MKTLPLLTALSLLTSPALAQEPTPTCPPGKIAPMEIAVEDPSAAEEEWEQESLEIFELVNSESMDGWLHLNLAAEEVAAAIDSELTRGEFTFWGALGVYVQPWHYPDLGLTIDMMSEEIGGPQEVLSVTLNAPSTMVTARGIKVGSTVADVQAAYGDEQELGTAGAENIFVAGSIYGGVIFTFEGDRVTEIFLGAGAE